MNKIIKNSLLMGVIVASQIFNYNIAGAKPVTDISNASLTSVEDTVPTPVPMLVKLEQISPNQIEITYDKNVDMKLGTKSTNYWLQDTTIAKPTGVATLGKNDKVNATNSLRDNMVKIEPKNGLGNTFILTFSQNITTGTGYKLIICYVTVEGAPPYSGDNGTAVFVGK